MEREAVDAVLGFDVDRFAVGIGQHAAHGRRDHAMAVRVTEDDHAAADHRIGHEEAVVDAADTDSRALPAMISDLTRGDVGHLRRLLLLWAACSAEAHFDST